MVACKSANIDNRDPYSRLNRGRPLRGLHSCTVSLSSVTSETGGEVCCILACASPHAEILPWDGVTASNLAVCKDFAWEGVTAGQIMIWEQGQAGDRVGTTRRRLQR